MLTRRDSFSLLRETLRWRVALVLALLIAVLSAVLGATNTRLGLHDTALLAWIVLVVASACAALLLWLPRGLGGTLFFATNAVLLIGVVAFGLYVGRPMQHWCYIFPPIVIFLLRAGPALVAMLGFGVYASLGLVPLVPGIDVIRFASGYGLLVCFMYTYALLQERAADMLRYHSDRDALTNCYNRRTFNEELAHLAETASGSAHGVLLLLDIDHFKSINDQHGHLAGDRVITQAAAVIGRALPSGVPLYRYGGEEFAVILPDSDLGEGEALAERLRIAVEAGEATDRRITISVGVAIWKAESAPPAAALERADAALYRAKREGRNRVVVA